MLDNNQREEREGRRPFAMDLISDLGDNKAVGGGFLGAMPASFATQMGFGTVRGPKAGSDEDQSRMGKLMLARMNTLELGFREVLKEVKDWRRIGDEEGKGGAAQSRRKERDGKTGKALGKRREEEEIWVDEEDGGGGNGNGNGNGGPGNNDLRVGMGSSI